VLDQIIPSTTPILLRAGGWICRVKLNAWNPGYVLLHTRGVFGATAVDPQLPISVIQGLLWRVELSDKTACSNALECMG